jgi:peptidoglycan hydrolase CwlO-like protein
LAPTRTAFAALAGGLALAFACALSLIVGSGLASALTLEQKQSAARERIERESAAIEASKADLEAAQAEAEDAAAREAGLSGLLAAGEQRSAELSSRLDEAESALAESRKRLERARRFLAERLVAIYITGGVPDTLDLAMGASSFDQLASGTAYLTAIQDSDERLARRVAELRRELQGRVGGLEEARQAVDAHNAALAAARDQIAAVRMEAEASAATLASANAEREASIDSLKGDIAGWQKQVRKQQQVSAEQAEEEVAQNLGGPYSIPTYIVMCESGGDYSALNPSSGAGGAYQIIPSTWEAYGGEGLPQEASRAEQDRIAALIWADVGASAWSCA